MISAAVASVVTSVNNWIRIREIKEHANNLTTAVLSEQQKLKETFLETIPDMNNLAKKLDTIQPDLQSHFETEHSDIKNSLKIDVEEFSKSVTDIIKCSIHSEFDGAFQKFRESISILIDDELNTKLPPLTNSEILLLETAETQTLPTPVEYSYKKIATTMAFGAAIGTLVTAFFFGTSGV